MATWQELRPVQVYLIGKHTEEELGVNYVIGLGLALLFGWLSMKLGERIRQRLGKALPQVPAAVVGLAVGFGTWALLRWLLPLDSRIINGPAIGLGVGLMQGLMAPRETKRG